MGSNRYCVIMAGGIGSRFWPLSRKSLPKQFLDFFGTGRTLIQQTYDRYKKIVAPDKIFVVTNKKYVELVKQQLPEIPQNHILAEPTRRNTAPCIAWATFHLHTQDPDASVVFTPADQLIINESEFIEVMNQGFQFAEKESRMLCVGVKPSRPETRYGYIQTSDDEQGIFHRVKTFTEKPERELAEIFVDSGEFYWNAGIFLAHTQTIVNAFHAHVPELCSHFDVSDKKLIYGTRDEETFIQKIFPSCPNESIEYGILEKLDNVYVMTCDIGWSDLGTWDTYHDALEKDANGNVVVDSQAIYYNCKECLISTTNKKKVIVTEGLNNFLVVDTDDVLLICPQESTTQIRKYINDIQAKMGEEFV